MVIFIRCIGVWWLMPLDSTITTRGYIYKVYGSVVATRGYVCKVYQSVVAHAPGQHDNDPWLYL